MQKDSKFKAWLNYGIQAWPGQLSETLCQIKKKKKYEADNMAQW